MKNKKLLTRLFALLASLVLVFALSLPCFADSVEGNVSYVIDTIAFTDRVSLYNWLLDNYTRVVNANFTYQSASTLRFDNVIALMGDRFAFQHSEVVPSLADGGGFNAVSTFTAFYVSNEGAEMLLGAQISGGVGEFSDIPDDLWDDLLVVVTITYLSPIENSGGSTDPTSPSSDMYSNLFNILKDAVYGSDAELTGSQEYALTLISTILTYATILLPIILVIFIAIWCFKRF